MHWLIRPLQVLKVLMAPSEDLTAEQHGDLAKLTAQRWQNLLPGPEDRVSMLHQLLDLLLTKKLQPYQLGMLVELLETRDRYVALLLSKANQVQLATIDLLVAKVWQAA